MKSSSEINTILAIYLKFIALIKRIIDRTACKVFLDCWPVYAKESHVSSRFSISTAALALSMAFIIAPALLDMTNPFAIDSAFAKQGGNGNGNSGGNGNGNSGGNGNGNSGGNGNGNSGGNGNGNSGGNGNGNSGGNGNGNSGNGNGNSSTTTESNSSKSAATEKVSKDKIAPKLGALNAAHASASAFAHASPKSRVGKIKTYYVANQVALTAQTTADETDAAALRGAFDGSGPASVLNAYEALQTDPTNPTLQNAYNQAVTDAALTGEQIVAVESAYADWKSAADADAVAANAAEEAQAALDAAANKTPVSAEARAALDALLVGKIN
jgi:hypothetical protein